MVLDMSAFTAISLELAYMEFKERYVSINSERISTYLGAAQEEEKKSTSAPAGKWYKKA